MSQTNERQEAKAAPDLTNTPEFHAAVALAAQAAIDKALPSIMESLAKASAPAAMPMAGDFDAKAFFSQMALSIAEISDQGSNRKRVAPEILAKRAEAHSRMIDAVLSVKRAIEDGTGERPKYRVIAKTYLNERFIEPFIVDLGTKKAEPVEIYWNGVPNEVMRPLNDAAKLIYGHFCDAIGSVTKEQKQAAQWVTAGGLVIVGEGPQRRAVADVTSPFEDDLGIVGSGQHDPNKPLINVLGTTAPAARQNFSDVRN